MRWKVCYEKDHSNNHSAWRLTLFGTGRRANIYSISPLGSSVQSTQLHFWEPILGTAKNNLLPLEISLESPGKNFKFRQSLGNPIVKCKHKTAATEFCQCSLLLACPPPSTLWLPYSVATRQGHASGSTRPCYCYWSWNLSLVCFCAL